MKLKGVNCLPDAIAALRAGDIAVFENLYDLFEPRLFAFAMHLLGHKEEAEEIVQEVFLKVWEGRSQLNPEQNFGGYLFSIAKNIAYNRARHRAYEVAFAQYFKVTGTGAGCFTEETIAYRDLERLLQETYATLPPVRRQVFVLSRLEGKSNGEIAQLLSTSTSNIENHLHKALKAIREKLRISNAL
ncbi:RNA polymerase sigma factor [Pontibacter kalidii]|uniref:RNA polymerase sigma factor n=1 Tax=Pontibacter kalidii TaxID=2592049 RepID=UPI00224FD376|nr:RNA polymerase sigma-70 factor [Pontibacter kalidii]